MLHASLADLNSCIIMLLVSFRKSRSLHLLAKFRDIHGFVALDTLHFLEEELS